MKSAIKGFSLVEVIAALATSLGIGVVVFQLFHQNERAFRDQNLIVEMQQSARVVASQIADELRMAGEGVPIYAATFDEIENEAVAAILPTSTNDRIDFRAGLSGTESYVKDSAPINLTLDASATLTVGDGAPFEATLGTSTPTGRFVYLWGPTGNSMWTWVRAELTRISPTTLTVVPRQMGDEGRWTGTVRFTQSPTVWLEEAVSFYLENGSIRRATAAHMAGHAGPTWSAANEIGRNFSLLGFSYYDKNNNVVRPSSLTNRVSIARIDVRVAAQTAERLADGDRPSYALSLRTIPRNLRIR